MATVVFCEDNPTIRKLILVAMRGCAHHEREVAVPAGSAAVNVLYRRMSA